MTGMPKIALNYVGTTLKGSVFCLLASFVFGAYAHAVTFQNHNALYAAAQQFIKSSFRQDQDIEITIGNLDRRLRLRACDDNLETSWPEGSVKSGKVSIRIRCTEAAGWKIYISAYITEFKPVYTAARAILRGDTLSFSDLSLERQSLSSARNGYIVDLKPYSGYLVKRSLRIGEILSPKHLQAPKLIKRGTKVTLLARSKGIEVRMAGTALSDGAAGEIIKVRNLSSKKIIEAKVISHGIAQVHM